VWRLCTPSACRVSLDADFIFLAAVSTVVFLMQRIAFSIPHLLTVVKRFFKISAEDLFGKFVQR
ncbi:hypothetical protein RUMCAL_02543, partial [Ruminococcus callidus ATCC 27760]